jgi:hypothetical protein
MTATDDNDRLYLIGKLIFSYIKSWFKGAGEAKNIAGYIVYNESQDYNEKFQNVCSLFALRNASKHAFNQIKRFGNDSNMLKYTKFVDRDDLSELKKLPYDE